MKSILTIIAALFLVVSANAQTRNVVVNTNNAVISPTNFWSADAANARSGLGLGTAATNASTAFQPSSSILTNLANNNGATLTNIPVSGVVGALATNGNAVALTNFPELLLRTNGNGSALTNITANNITGTVALASNVSGIIAIINGGTGSTNVATARTNLGLGWSALTNTTSSGFQADLFGVNTNPVLVNASGSVVSPTNFWQVAPISTIVQSLTNITSNSTNVAANARNLWLYSLSPSVSGVTNVITLPTNGSTFSGDVATIIHSGNTNTVTAIRQLGSVTNIIVLNQLDEAVKLVYKDNTWTLADNISYIEPIYFSGTNATANAAASRTNLGLGEWSTLNDGANIRVNGLTVSDGEQLDYIQFNSGTGVEFFGNRASQFRSALGLGATWLTNTNVTNFRTAIGLGSTNNVTFSNVVASGTLTSTGVVTAITNLNVGGAIAVTNAALTRTNLGLPLPALTNTSNTNFQAAVFTTNSIPTNSANINAINFNTAVAWMGITVVTNGVTNTFRIPLFQ
jgi:hypothetical protein